MVKWAKRGNIVWKVLRVVKQVRNRDIVGNWKFRMGVKDFKEYEKGTTGFTERTYGRFLNPDKNCYELDAWFCRLYEL